MPDGTDNGGLLLHVSYTDYQLLLAGLADAASWLDHKPTSADGDHESNRQQAAEYRRLFTALDGAQ